MTVFQFAGILHKDTPVEIISELYHNLTGVYMSKDDFSDELLDKEIDEVFACNKYEEDWDMGFQMFDPILCVVLKGVEEDNNG